MPPASLTSLSAFNANAAMQRMGIDPLERGAEAASTRYIFKALKEEGLNQIGIEGQKALVELTVEKIEPRLSMLQDYGENFGVFENDERYEALLTAIICDEQITFANVPSQNKKGEIQAPKVKDFDDDLLKLAALYFDQAIELTLIPDINPASVMRESLFLAHINTLQMLNDLDIPFEERDIHDLVDFMEKELPAIRNFSAIETEIGKEVSSMAESWAEEIKRILSTQPPTPPGPPSLVVIE